ncbi:MAG: leucine-rich repeat domain-containing protein [Clostridia bacterium]|nr:leucine-rich repeat domain-containing protein [Clostridia bacterium]
MLKRIGWLMALALALTLIGAQAEEISLDGLMGEIEEQAELDKALAVGPVAFEISADRQSIFLDRPEVTGSDEYTIAYNIYDADSQPVNYFYSLGDRVAATPGYGGLFNVFVVVTDTATGAQNTQNIGWTELDWPHAARLTVGQATYEISEDGKSIYVDRPEIRCASGKVSIAYNIYDSASNPVNYFYSTRNRVAATPGYDGKFIVFIVVTDTDTGEQNVQNTGWHVIGEDPTNEDGGYVYILADGRATIIGYRGEETSLTIPAELGGKPVAAIAPDAFRDHKALTSVKIPASVAEIGSGAFRNCTGLKSLWIEDGITAIQESTFEGCSVLNNVVIPATVTQIGPAAFRKCTGLKALTIPGSVREIGKEAFDGCRALEAIDFIGNQAQWQAITKGSNAIRSGTVINYWHGSCGYHLLWKLESGSLTVSGAGAMYNYEQGTAPWYGDRYAIQRIYMRGAGTVGWYAFCDCPNLTTVSLGNSVTRINDRAFQNCPMLKTLDYLNKLETIGGMAFTGCKGLTRVDLPETVVSIGNYAFSECSQLKTFTMHNGVTSIGTKAFGWCGQLRRLAFYGTQSQWAELARGDLGLNDSVSVVCCDGSCGPDTFWTLSGDGVLTIVGTGTISADLVYDEGWYEYVPVSYWYGMRDQVRSVIICEGVEYIGNYAFENLNSVKEVKLPGSIKMIGEEQGGIVFAGCSSLERINLPEGLTSIGWRSFGGCTSLKEISLPQSLITLGSEAFANCRNLTEVALPDNLKVLREGVFSGCTSLTSVSLPDSLITIYSSVFKNCTSLKSIQLPEGLTVIYTSTFENCRSLKSIRLPDGLTELGNRAFAGCAGLTDVYIPDSVTKFGDNVFAGCTGLADADGFVSYGDAIRDYTGTAEEAAIPRTAATVYLNAFSGNEHVIRIVVPITVTKLIVPYNLSVPNLRTILYEGTQEQWRQILSGNQLPGKISIGYNYRGD